MITKEELDNLISEIEQDRVKKTISTSDATKFGEAICSFCNDFPNHNKPGYLIIGVNDGKCNFYFSILRKGRQGWVKGQWMK